MRLKKKNKKMLKKKKDRLRLFSFSPFYIHKTKIPFPRFLTGKKISKLQKTRKKQQKKKIPPKHRNVM